jgi:phosphoserine aminotransferase
MRAHNFSAGPAVMPEPVLTQLQQDLWEVRGSGMGILECSHRGACFEAILAETKARLTRLLRLSDDQVVLFLHGGARTQFFQWPMNILRGGRATYFDTGIWASGAIEDARRYGAVDVPFSSKAQGYDRVPEPASWGPLPEGTVYLHYTANNTVAGSEFHYVPDAGGSLLACDMSSNFLSRPVDGSRFDYIYAGAQKNAGPSGVTVVVLRRSLLERMDRDLPKMLRYDVAVENDSMFNTPNTFGIHAVGLVAKWIEDQGGLTAIEARNIAKADRVYAAIDASSLFRGKVQKGSRSRMNVTFTTGSTELDDRFVKAAKAEGLTELKGHRTLGGLRASMYNAQTDSAIDALVSFLGHFERANG